MPQGAHHTSSPRCVVGGGSREGPVPHLLDLVCALQSLLALCLLRKVLEKERLVRLQTALRLLHTPPAPNHSLSLLNPRSPSRRPSEPENARNTNRRRRRRRQRAARREDPRAARVANANANPATRNAKRETRKPGFTCFIHAEVLRGTAAAVGAAAAESAAAALFFGFLYTNLSRNLRKFYG
jgi:hypothetical protein